MDLKELGPRFITPYHYINRAFTLESLGFDKAATEEAFEALKIIPNYLEAFKILGKIYGKSGDYEKSFEYFRLAVLNAPYDTDLRSNLALAFEKMGDGERAIKQYETIPHDNGGFSFQRSSSTLDNPFITRQRSSVLDSMFQFGPPASTDINKINVELQTL